MSNVPSWYQFYCGGLGVVTAGCYNWFYKKPLISGLPRYAFFIAIGIGAGTMLEKFEQNRTLERELVIHDYIRLHPEDFPELDKKKYKDVLLPWHPRRN